MHRKSLEAAEHIRKQDEIDFGENSDSNSNSNTNNNTMTSSTSSANSSPNETHKSSIDGNKPNESLMSPESNHELSTAKMPNFLNLINNLNDLDSKTMTANTAKSHGHKKAANTNANGEPSANIDFKTKSVANLRAKAKEHCKLLNDIFNGSSKIKKPPSQNDHHQSKFKIDEKNSARINCDEIID